MANQIDAAEYVPLARTVTDMVNRLIAETREHGGEVGECIPPHEHKNPTADDITVTRERTGFLKSNTTLRITTERAVSAWHFDDYMIEATFDHRNRLISLLSRWEREDREKEIQRALKDDPNAKPLGGKTIYRFTFKVVDGEPQSAEVEVIRRD